MFTSQSKKIVSSLVFSCSIMVACGSSATVDEEDVPLTQIEDSSPEIKRTSIPENKSEQQNQDFESDDSFQQAKDNQPDGNQKVGLEADVRVDSGQNPETTVDFDAKMQNKDRNFEEMLLDSQTLVPAVNQSYSLTYDQTKNLTLLRAQFRVATGTGDTIRLKKGKIRFGDYLLTNKDVLGTNLIAFATCALNPLFCLFIPGEFYSARIVGPKNDSFIFLDKMQNLTRTPVRIPELTQKLEEYEFNKRQLSSRFAIPFGISKEELETENRDEKIEGKIRCSLQIKQYKVADQETGKVEVVNSTLRMKGDLFFDKAYCFMPEKRWEGIELAEKETQLRVEYSITKSLKDSFGRKKRVRQAIKLQETLILDLDD